MTLESILVHHGVKGQKWGIRKGSGPTAIVSHPGHGFATLNITPGSKDHKQAISILNKAAATPVSKEHQKKFDEINARYPDDKKFETNRTYQNNYRLEMRKVWGEHFRQNMPKGLTADVGTLKSDPLSGIVIVGNKAGVAQTFSDFGLVHENETPQAVVCKLVENIDSSGRIISTSVGEELMHSDGDVFLAHHGVKGQKWGIRRRGRTPTSSAGAAVAKPEHTNSSAGHLPEGVHHVTLNAAKHKHASVDAITYRDLQKKVKKHSLHSLSNEELRKLTTRFDLEQKYSKMASEQKKKRASPLGRAAKKVLDKALDKTLNDVGQALGTKTGHHIINKSHLTIPKVPTP